MSDPSANEQPSNVKSIADTITSVATAAQNGIKDIVKPTQTGGKRRGRKTRRASNPWTDLVKRVFNENKHKSGYKFKHALMDAKKIYKGAVVEPNRVGTRAAQTVANSVANTVGKFADNAIGLRTRRRRTRGRK